MICFYLCVCAQVIQGPEKPVLAVLTDRDLLLYPSLPESKEGLNSPTKSHPLITTRFSITARFAFIRCNSDASSTLRRFRLRDLSVGSFFLAGQQEQAHSFHYETVGQFSRWHHTGLENMSETRIYESCFSLFSISPELSAWSWSLLKQTHLHTVLLAVIFDFNYPHPSKPFSSPVRLVHSGPGKSSPLLDSDLSFGLRTGTKQGVETHVFRVDSAKDLSTWTHLLVEGCHNAAELIKEVTTGEEPGSGFLHRQIRMFRSWVNLYHLFLGVAHYLQNQQRRLKMLSSLYKGKLSACWWMVF